MSAVKTEEDLREGQEHDGINDGEGEHVTSDHAINHRDEWTSQSNSSGKKHEKEPGGRHGEDKDGFFGVSPSSPSSQHSDFCNIRR
jgi:hypothetical protein